MPRPIPEAFVNKDTYGVNTAKERDRLPQIPQGSKVTLQDVLEAPDDLPTRICLAALESADDADDIARLVFGALVDSSGTQPAAAKLSTFKSAIASDLGAWSLPLLYGVDREVKSTTEAGETVVNVEKHVPSVADHPAPKGNFPDWLQTIPFADSDLLFAMSLSSVETAFYAGVLSFAIGKEPTPENFEAFNSKRRHTVERYLSDGDPKVFVDGSKYLTLEILQKVHRVFNVNILDRAQVLGAIVDRDTALVSGKARAFYVIFRLGEGASLNPILIIVRFARKYPGFYAHFPDLETEYHAASHALQRFYDVPEIRRMYLKVIFGSAYVPVDRADINALLGVAVFALQQTEPSLANYSGGTLSVAHREKVLELLGKSVVAEEEVPETT